MTEQVAEREAVTVSDARTVHSGAPAPIRISWAPVPRVNLLPNEIVERRQFRQVQIMLSIAVGVVLLVVVAGTVLAQRAVGDANRQLDVAQAAVEKLQAQTTKYAEVPRVIAQVEAARAARAQAMAGDVLWYRYLNDLNGAQPSGVTMNSITISVNATAGAASAAQAPGADALTPAGVGTVKVDGSAHEYRQISSWLESLDTITGLSVSSLTQAAAEGADGDEKVTFSSGAVIDNAALSHRYDQKAN